MGDAVNLTIEARLTFSTFIHPPTHYYRPVTATRQQQDAPFFAAIEYILHAFVTPGYPCHNPPHPPLWRCPREKYAFIRLTSQRYQSRLAGRETLHSYSRDEQAHPIHLILLFAHWMVRI